MIVEVKNGIKKATYSEMENGFMIAGKDVFIDKNRTTYCKQINIPTTEVARLYNNKGKCVGSQVYQTKELTEEHIIIPSKRMCKVILHRDGKKFIGVSKCRKDDEFNVTKGIKIAGIRATIKEKQYKLQELIK